MPEDPAAPETDDETLDAEPGDDLFDVFADDPAEPDGPDAVPAEPAQAEPAATEREADVAQEPAEADVAQEPAEPEPSEVVGDVTEAPGFDPLEGALAAPGTGTLQVPLSPVAANRIRWGTVSTTAAGALALLVANASGYAPTLVVTLALALAVAWGWPVLSGSFTPDASTIVLAVAAVAVVLAALRDDLLWVAAAVAFGIVLSFAAQLLRRTGREGLVLTLLSSFGGLAVIGSGATGVVAANSARGTAVAVVAFAAVAVAVTADLLAGVRAAAPLLGLVALVAGTLAGVLVAARFDEVSALTGLGIGAAVGTLSWSFRRVLALEPAMTTLRGQVGAGASSVIAMGAVVHLFAVLG